MLVVMAIPMIALAIVLLKNNGIKQDISLQKLNAFNNSLKTFSLNDKTIYKNLHVLILRADTINLNYLTPLEYEYFKLSDKFSSDYLSAYVFLDEDFKLKIALDCSKIKDKNYRKSCLSLDELKTLPLEKITTELYNERKKIKMCHEELKKLTA